MVRQTNNHNRRQRGGEVAAPTSVNKAEVFKAYDIRGRCDNGEITPALMQNIAQALAEKIPQSAVLVGHDIRLTSEELAQAFMSGLKSRSKEVLYLGLSTTDLICYASVIYNLPAAMITASHNPAHYNGVKLYRSGGQALFGDEIANLKQSIALMTAHQQSIDNFTPEKDLTTTITENYLDHLLSLVECHKIQNLRIAVDGGNGMANLLIQPLCKRLPIQIHGLHLKPDGLFPNHPADPSKQENLSDLISLVQAKKCHLGVAFDGDADRAVFVDDRGEVISGDMALVLLSRWILETTDEQNPAIVYDSISSRSVPEIIAREGGRAIRSRVGTPFVKEAMRKNKALFGGETSGHCYFRQNFDIDSGLFTMLAVCQMLSAKDSPLSTIRQQVNLYPSSGEISFKVPDNPLALTEYLKTCFSQADIEEFDGLSVVRPDVWFNLRASNTEPIMRLNVEGHSSEVVKRMTLKLRDIISNFQGN